MERIHTFRSIAEACRRDKRTVQSWYSKALIDEQCDEIGIIDPATGARVFNDAERAILMNYFVESVVPKRKQSAPQVEVVAGGQMTVIESPQFDGLVDLSQFLSPTEIQQIDDPGKAVDAVFSFLDVVENHFEKDLEKRQADLSKTRKARQRASDRVRDFSVRAELYKRDAAAIAREQNQQTEDLTEDLNKVKSMGKSDSDAA
jgi:hypothetical protein